LSNTTYIKQNKNTLLEREQYYLDNINPSYNICKFAGSPLGIKHGILFSKNLSAAKRGKKNNISSLIKDINKSKIITCETKLKMSSRSRGIGVKIFDHSNNLINQFSTMISAAKYLGVSDRTIRRILNTGISYDNYVYHFEVASEQPIIVVNK
jgi:group I intron endonuclease